MTEGPLHCKGIKPHCVLEEQEEKLLDTVEKLKARNCGGSHQSATVSNRWKVWESQQ